MWATNHRSCSARRREEAFLNRIVAARHAVSYGRRRGCGRAGEPRRSTTDHQRVTLACAENDGVLNVFGCGRLVGGIGFLRVAASKYVGVTGVLTYPRKPGGT